MRCLNEYLARRANLEHPAIMQRLKLDPDIWDSAMRPQGNVFGRAMGRLDRLRLHAAALDQCWVGGMYRAKRAVRAERGIDQDNGVCLVKRCEAMGHHARPSWCWHLEESRSYADVGEIPP